MEQNVRSSLLIKQISGACAHSVEVVLASKNLTMSQMVYMSFISRSGTDGIPLEELRRKFDVPEISTMAILKNLCERHFVQIEDDPLHTERKSARLTKIGQAVIQDVEDENNRMEQRLLSPLSPEERSSFKAMLKKVAEAMVP